MIHWSRALIDAADASQRVAVRRKAATAKPTQIAGPWRIAVTDELADFVDFWPRTDRARDARYHVFQCADILEVWLQTIGRARGVRPCFVGVFGADGQPQMLLPLGIYTKNGVRILTFLDGTVSDYNSPVLFPCDREWTTGVVAKLWRDIVAALPAFDVVTLKKMPARVQDITNPLILLHTVPHAEAGHRIRLSGSWHDFETQRLPRRKGGRRKLRKLSAFGPVSFEVAETAEQAITFLNAMVDNKRRQFVSTCVPGFELPGKLDYFVEITRRCGWSGPVHLSALKVGESIVASHWGLVAGGRFYHMMSSHAGGQWEPCSPGRLLNDFLICKSFELGMETFDFGVGDESYKHEYCDEIVPLHDLAEAVSVRGRLYLQIQAGLERLRKTSWWRALRPYKWILLRALRR